MQLPVNHGTQHPVDGAASSFRQDVMAAGFEPAPPRSMALTDWLIGATAGGPILKEIKMSNVPALRFTPSNRRRLWETLLVALIEWLICSGVLHQHFHRQVQCTQRGRTLWFIYSETLGLHFDSGHQKKWWSPTAWLKVVFFFFACLSLGPGFFTALTFDIFGPLHPIALKQQTSTLTLLRVTKKVKIRTLPQHLHCHLTARRLLVWSWVACSPCVSERVLAKFSGFLSQFKNMQGGSLTTLNWT